MTKKNFEFLAEVLGGIRFDSWEEEKATIHAVVKHCKEDNPLFSEDRFLKAVFGSRLQELQAYKQEIGGK